MRIEELGWGDSGYIPSGYGHYIESMGDEPARVLFGFNSGTHKSVSASEWLGRNTTQLLATNFGVPESVIKKLVLGNQFVRKGNKT
jgi:oxalate decarboxylase